MSRRSRDPGPAPTTWKGDPAGIASRSVAYIIDAMVISVLVTGTLFAVDSIVTVLAPDADSTMSDAAAVVSVGLVAAVITITYFTVAVWLFGQTVGKLLMGVRVVRRDGGRPHLGQSLLRAFAYGISSILMLGFLAIAVSRQRRAWHDHIARTWVVYDWEARPRIATVDDGEPLPPHRLP